MGKIKDWFEKVKHFFFEEDFAEEDLSPTIEIHDRNDTNPQPVGDILKITIGEIHKHTSQMVGTNVCQREVNVRNPNLGHGITVKKQHKPGRCPLCATKGKVVENTVGEYRWKCTECGSTFN